MSFAGMKAKSAPQTTMEIEQWAADSIVLPASSQSSANPFLKLADSFKKMPGMEPLTKALAKVKGTPLCNRISIVTTGSDGKPKAPVITTAEVVSVSEMPLSASLFQVPAGYRKVDTAPMPDFPKQVSSR